VTEVKDWDQYFMEMVYLTASRSKDDSTKVGAVIVGQDHGLCSAGYNSFVRGINDFVEERYERPEKYKWFEHAERNAVYNAARKGIPLEGTIMYTNGTPCSDCGRAVIQAGIVEIVTHHLWEERCAEMMGDWLDSLKATKTMFEEAGVKMRVYDGPLDLDLGKGLLRGKPVLE
jgi:dCMP deaminase